MWAPHRAYQYNTDCTLHRAPKVIGGGPARGKPYGLFVWRGGMCHAPNDARGHHINISGLTNTTTATWPPCLRGGTTTQRPRVLHSTRQGNHQITTGGTHNKRKRSTPQAAPPRNAALLSAAQLPVRPGAPTATAGLPGAGLEPSRFWAGSAPVNAADPSRPPASTKAGPAVAPGRRAPWPPAGSRYGSRP